MRKKRVLVTGGAGFLGSCLVEWLRQRNWCEAVFVPRSRVYDLRGKEAVVRLYEDNRPDIPQSGHPSTSTTQPPILFGLSMMYRSRRNGVKWWESSVGTVLATAHF